MKITRAVRFRLECVVAAASAILALVTALLPDWFEKLFDWAPDAGSGEAEWGLVLALLAVSLVSGWLARTDWRRLARA